MIITDGLTKKFGDLAAVSNLNLKIEQGICYGFLGPNGAGKTTTIKMLTGLVRPTQGKAFIGGYDIQMEPEKAKSIIGYIPDKPYLYEKLTAREFFRFIAGLYDLKEEDYLEKTNYFLELFELENWRDELIESYSHGMRQKIIISAAFMHNPKVIIVDEPLVGLDPKGAKIVKKLFLDFVKSGMTIFMSTHTLALAEEICDRIGIINHGVVIAEGTKEELRQATGSGDKRLESIFLELTGAGEV